MTPNCKIHPVPATGTCNNCRAFTCDKCVKVGRPCPFCKLADIVPAGEARKSVNQCVNHPGIRAHAACPDCGRIFCASCLNPFGQCLECGGKNPKQKPTLAPHNAREAGRHARTIKKKRYYLGVTRVAIGLAVLAGVGAFANWQLNLIKSSIPAKGKRPTGTVAGNVTAYKKAVEAHGKDLSDIMGRIESGEYSDADSKAVDDLMGKIEAGDETAGRMDPAMMERLEKAKVMLERGHGQAESDDDERADSGRSSDWNAYKGPPIRLRVGAGRMAAKTERSGARVAYRPRPVQVAITAPAPGARVHGNTIVSARLAGDDVQRVEFQVNGQWQGISNQPPYRFEWDTTGMRNGAVTLRVVAIDGNGKPHPSPPLRVTVQN